MAVYISVKDLDKLEMGDLVILAHSSDSPYPKFHFKSPFILAIVVDYYHTNVPFEGLWTFHPWTYSLEQGVFLDIFEKSSIRNIVKINLEEITENLLYLNDSRLIEDWIKDLQLEILLTHKSEVLRAFAKKQLFKKC